MDSDLATSFAAIVIGASAVWLLYTAVRAWSIRRRSVERIERLGPDEPADSAESAGWFSRWLALAGYHRAGAAALFVLVSSAAMGLGALAAFAFTHTVLDDMLQTVSNIPGGIGEAFVAILRVGSWIVFFVVALAPALVVRAARRRRVSEIEADLPLALELFATLAEAGLSFDAAMARIVEARSRERPLMREFIGFQQDVRAGVPRVQALRRLASRTDVMPMTVFLSAVIQSEQVGSSLAETLRHQSDDLRQRRREQALTSAQALPVKLVFPLVACFLPGVFISTLGPVLYQMIQVADSVLRPIGR